MTTWRDRVLVAVGTCFGLGYAPIAPGTAGALLGVAIYYAVVLTAPAAYHPWLLAAALLITCVVTVAMTPWAERYWKKKDPGIFVTDEVAGFLVTVLLFPPPNLWLAVAWAFVVTRAVDIIKPQPARWLEKLPGGWGVLLDDICSSIYAAALLHLIAWVLPAVMGIEP